MLKALCISKFECVEQWYCVQVQNSEILGKYTDSL